MNKRKSKFILLMVIETLVILVTLGCGKNKIDDKKNKYSKIDSVSHFKLEIPQRLFDQDAMSFYKDVANKDSSDEEKTTNDNNSKNKKKELNDGYYYIYSPTRYLYTDNQNIFFSAVANVNTGYDIKDLSTVSNLSTVLRGSNLEAIKDLSLTTNDIDYSETSAGAEKIVTAIKFVYCGLYEKESENKEEIKMKGKLVILQKDNIQYIFVVGNTMEDNDMDKSYVFTDKEINDMTTYIDYTQDISSIYKTVYSGDNKITGKVENSDVVIETDKLKFNKDDIQNDDGALYMCKDPDKEYADQNIESIMYKGFNGLVGIHNCYLISFSQPYGLIDREYAKKVFYAPKDSDINDRKPLVLYLGETKDSDINEDENSEEYNKVKKELIDKYNKMQKVNFSNTGTEIIKEETIYANSIKWKKSILVSKDEDGNIWGASCLYTTVLNKSMVMIGVNIEQTTNTFNVSDIGDALIQNVKVYTDGEVVGQAELMKTSAQVIQEYGIDDISKYKVEN